MQGQVYVKVEADAATPMLMSASGSSGISGQFSADYVVEWKYPGGVTGSFGWPNTYQPNASSTAEEINFQIQSRWNELDGVEKTTLFGKWMPSCAYFK